MFHYIGGFLLLALVAVITIVSALQFWPNDSRKNKLIAEEEEGTLSPREIARGEIVINGNTCGIEKPDPVQKNRIRSELKQDEFAASVSGCKRNGVYLDIGGHHPIEYSNTYLLEKRLDWTGFSVDPFPTANFDIRKGCKFDKIALGSKSVPMVFNTSDHDANRGGFDKFGGRSERGGKKVTITPETPTNYFARVNMPKIIDYMSIDVEGAELDILGAIDWNNFCARAITVEHNKIEAMKTKLNQLLTTKARCKLVRHQDFDAFYKCDC